MQMEKPKRKNTPSTQRIARIAVISGFVLIIGLFWTFRARLFPARLHITNIESVTIHDSWTGLLMSDPSPPFTAQYDLTIQGGSLIGTATYSAGYSGDTIQEDVVIPTEVVEAFHRKLNEARIIAGDYTPYFWITDDYPSISIIIETHDETIEIFTTSQKEEHTPWAANVKRAEYIINSAIPAQAMAILQPYLLVDIPDDMSEAANFVFPR